jgi:hypothetical protein
MRQVTYVYCSCHSFSWWHTLHSVSLPVFRGPLPARCSIYASSWIPVILQQGIFSFQQLNNFLLYIRVLSSLSLSRSPHLSFAVFHSADGPVERRLQTPVRWNTISSTNYSSKMWSRVTKDSDPRKTTLARASSIYKRQTSPLVGEGAQEKQDRNSQIVINIWSWTPDGARHQDLLIDWPSVAMQLWLWFWLENQVSQSG